MCERHTLDADGDGDDGCELTGWNDDDEETVGNGHWPLPLNHG